MKKARKLIPALAMLLISAVMMSTASFAWFSMNTSVKAEGMKVQATTSKNLVISANNTLGNSESDKVDFGSTTKELKPTSTSDFSKFFKADEKVDINSGALNTGATISEVGDAEADNYYAVYTFYVRVDGISTDTFEHLYVNEITVTSADSDLNDISKALRVGVVCDSTKLTFAPAGDADSKTYKPVKAAGVVGTDEVLGTQITAVEPGETSAADLGAVTTAYRTVKVYLWYEGQDKYCTTANSVNVEALNVSVNFVGK